MCTHDASRVITLALLCAMCRHTRDLVLVGGCKEWVINSNGQLIRKEVNGITVDKFQ